MRFRLYTWLISRQRLGNPVRVCSLQTICRCYCSDRKPAKARLFVPQLFVAPCSSQNGTDYSDSANAVAMTRDGAVIAAGSTFGVWSGSNVGSSDFIAFKLDSVGDLTWVCQVTTKGTVWNGLVDPVLAEAHGSRSTAYHIMIVNSYSSG